MTDIPDDIMQAANECVSEFRWNNDNRWHMFVARAILAERERSRQLLSEAEKREKEARAKAPFEFDRYINGKLMAEGVRIERIDTLEKAMIVAAKIASRGPNGEVPVLVLRASATTQANDEAVIRSRAIEDVLSALTAHELYQYRPKAFQGFIDYARSALQSEER